MAASITPGGPEAANTAPTPGTPASAPLATPKTPLPATQATPEQARAIARRAQLLAAASRLLKRGGTAAVTHRRVAEESDSSPGAVRYYFKTREDLLAACLADMEAARVATAERLLENPAVPGERPGPETVARRALGIYCGSELDDVAVAGTIWIIVDCSRESQRLAALLEQMRIAAEAQLKRLLAQCGYAAVPPRLVASVIDGSILSTALEGRAAAAAAAAAELAEFLRLTGLHPAASSLAE
ncbi:TetR/AcrR family transcriptional regulator [Leucobacter luti]|uniref:TetR family transcriptional regulator n=1 Tax=Leucobacter luti TaxID=340320 RepID=A0A4V6MCJ0_9MICO|nr:TetR/AcrR family transcriptional regulator [Leucobacter luti]RZT64739.1 TetR family transcriptional regulator [Leucobacter luti]